MALLSPSSPKWLFPSIIKSLREQVQLQIGGLVQIIKVIAPLTITADTYAAQLLPAIPAVSSSTSSSSSSSAASSSLLPSLLSSTVHPDIVIWLSDSQHCIQAYLTSTAIDNLYRNDDRIDTLQELQGSTVRLLSVSLCSTIHNDIDKNITSLQSQYNTNHPSSIQRIRYEPDISIIVDKFEYVGGIGNNPVGQPQQFNYDIQYINILQHINYSVLYSVAPRYSKIDNYLLNRAHFGPSSSSSSSTVPSEISSTGILINLSIHDIGIEPEQRKFIFHTERKYQQRKYQHTKDTAFRQGVTSETNYQLNNPEEENGPIEYPFFRLTAGTSSLSSSSSSSSTGLKSTSIDSGSTCPLFDDEKPSNPLTTTIPPVDNDDIEYTPLTQISHPVLTTLPVIDNTEAPDTNIGHKRNSSVIDNIAPIDDISISLAVDVQPSDLQPQPILKKLKSNITNRLLKGRNNRNQNSSTHSDNTNNDINDEDTTDTKQPSTENTEIIDYSITVPKSVNTNEDKPFTATTPALPSTNENDNIHSVNNNNHNDNKDELEQIYQDLILPSYLVSDEQPQPHPDEISKHMYTPYNSNHNSNKLNNKITPMLRLSNTPTTQKSTASSTKEKPMELPSQTFVSPVATDNHQHHTVYSSNTLPPMTNSATQISTAASSGYYGSLSSYSTERTTQSSHSSNNSTKLDMSTPLTTSSTRSHRDNDQMNDDRDNNNNNTNDRNYDNDSSPFILTLSNQKLHHHNFESDNTTNLNHNNGNHLYFIQTGHNNNNSQLSNNLPLPNAQPPVSMTTLMEFTTATTSSTSAGSDSNNNNNNNNEHDHSSGNQTVPHRTTLPGSSMLPSPSLPFPSSTMDENIVFHHNQQQQLLLLQQSSSLSVTMMDTHIPSQQLTPTVDLQQILTDIDDKDKEEEEKSTTTAPRNQQESLRSITTEKNSHTVPVPHHGGPYYTRIKPNHAAYRWVCSMDDPDESGSIHPRVNTLVTLLQSFVGNKNGATIPKVTKD